MEKECVYIKTNIFKEQWERLKRNYRDKTHTNDDANEYYILLKDLSNEDFENAITESIKEYRYFPNVAEIRNKVPHTEKTLQEWESTEKEPLDEEDIAYFKEHFKQFCDTEEEYQELLKRNGW